MQTRAPILASKPRFFCALMTAAIFACGCANSRTPASSSAVVNSSEPSSSALTISPSTATVTEGQASTFAASGGTGSGYRFSIVNGGSASGTVGAASGYFVASSGWAGTTYVILTDSSGSQAYATVTITQSSGGGGSTGGTGGNGNSTLAITPSTVSLTGGQTQTFTASGGSGTGYRFAISTNGQGAVDSVTGLYTAPSNWSGTTYVVLTDSIGDYTYATINVSAAFTTGSFCGSYDVDHVYGAIHSIACNGQSIAGGKCPSGYLYKTYFQADSDYVSTCEAVASGLAAPTGSFCGNYDADSKYGGINQISCNGIDIAGGNCPQGYTYETYFQAVGNTASTCVATTAGLPLAAGSFCGNYDVDHIAGVINNISCNGVSLAGGSCPAGYSYATYFQADGNFGSTCVMN